MYIFSSVARLRVERTQPDVRDYPSYSIDEAARYIGVPVRTLRSWISGYYYKTATGRKRARPIIEAADPHRNLLSFFNLAEAQVVAATREKNIGTNKVRRAVEYLRTELNTSRPLLTQVFHKSGQDLFINQLAGKRLRQPLNVSRYGQYGFRPILKKYLDRIERDAQGMPLLIYPLRPGHKDRYKRVEINPLVSLGKPALKGSGVMVETIWYRKRAGESIPELARDYRLKPSDIKAAIRYFDTAA